MGRSATRKKKSKMNKMLRVSLSGVVIELPNRLIIQRLEFYIAVANCALHLSLFVRLEAKALKNVNTLMCTVRLALQCERQGEREVFHLTTLSLAKII